MKILIVLISIFLFISCNNSQQQSTTPPLPIEKVRLYTAEPFITVEIREDRNEIIVRSLDPTGTNMVNYTYPYSTPVVNGGYNEHTIGGIYSQGVVILWFIRYKTATPFNSCERPMEGTMMELTCNISMNGGQLWGGCGENVP